MGSERRRQGLHPSRPLDGNLSLRGGPRQGEQQDDGSGSGQPDGSSGETGHPYSPGPAAVCKGLYRGMGSAVQRPPDRPFPRVLRTISPEVETRTS